MKGTDAKDMSPFERLLISTLERIADSLEKLVKIDEQL